MADNWDDSDDDWDVDSDEDELDKKLGLKKEEDVPTFEEEEDLALAEKARQMEINTANLKKKGQALAAKKEAEEERKMEEELARKAMEMEAEMEENMTTEERRLLEKRGG